MPAEPEPRSADAEHQLATGWEAFAVGDAVTGERAARAALAVDAQDGEAWYLLAVCLERASRLGDADRAFSRAAAARRDPQPLPYRVTWARFQALVDAARERLPAAFTAAFAEVTVVLADYADPDHLADRDAPELLGLFTGQERGDRSATGEDLAVSPCIHLFRRAHEHHCSSLAELAEEVRRTLFHEFGHYLGYDEEGLAAIGLE